jgi:hypothetical protein
MKSYLFVSAIILFFCLAPADAQTIKNQWPTNANFAGGLDYDIGSDTVWVADENAVVILQFDRIGNPLTSFAPPKSLPIGVGVDPVTGNVWIGDESEWVDEVTPAGVPTGRSWSTQPAITDVSGLAFDPATGNIYVSQDSFPQTIAEFDPNGLLIQTIDITGAGSTDPDGLAYNPVTMTFFLGEDTNDSVLEVNMAGNLVNSWFTGGLGISPEGLGLDAVAGTLFVGDGFGNTVFELSGMIDPSGSLLVDTNQISGREGGVVNFSLIGGAANAGRSYFLLGCASGTDPGTLLPGGMATLPLNIDYLTDVIVLYMNTSLFSQFMGGLDGSGNATAQMNTLGLGSVSQGCLGVTMNFAYALNGPWDFASNAVGVQITP